MASARVSFLVAVAATLVASSCGGGSSPVAPVSPTPAPVSSPAAGDEGASANTCPIGKGDPDAACTERSPQLLAAMESAIDRLVRERPGIFNLGEEAAANTGQYRVLDKDAYVDGVIANLRAAGFCAERTLDQERVAVKGTNDFSEEWDVITSTGFVRRGTSSYRATCTPARFPLEPSEIISYVRVGIYEFICPPGVTTPRKLEGKLPLMCDGLVTATPKQRNGTDVPLGVHGAEIRWELREGEDVVRVDPDTRFSNPFNKVLRTTGRVDMFVLCATVLGKEGCLNGQTIP